MELKHVLRQQKHSKFHPSWILVVVALTLLIAGTVWLPAWLVPHLDRKPDRPPSLSPTTAKVIMVSSPQAEWTSKSFKLNAVQAPV